MQRVFRSSFVGLLTIASLAACGDKVTIPQATTATPDGVVHSVTVSPAAASVDVGKSITLAASVDAGAGVTVRTVTWSSSDATVASVVAGTGVVTGVKAGTATIIATSAADVNVKGAAAITVGAGAQNPTVTISAINQNNGVTSIPANLANAFGQLDVVLNVEPNGQTLKTVSATLTCGTKSISASQTVSDLAPVAAEAAAVPITLSFNTAAFNATTGVVALNNGACTISAVATTAAGTQSATNGTQLTVNNVDGVLVSNAFAAITNAEGVAQGTSANDAFGLPWKSGSVTVTALPVLYSGRTLSSITITLPGATGSTQTITAAPFSATWSGSATSGSRVTGLTLVDNSNCVSPVVPPACGLLEVNGVTPKGVTPTVIALDAAGNDLGLAVLNAGVANSSTFRLDNTAPEAPLAFNTPGRQSNWVNAAYVFTGVGAGQTNGNVNPLLPPPTGSQNFISCGDGPNIVALTNTTASVNPYACVGQLGVSASGNNAVGVGTSSTNGNTTLTYYAIPAGSFVAASGTNGTSTSATACSTAGWTKIATAGDLAATTVATAYVVRVFETDKLGNARCTDLAKVPNTAQLGAFINTGVAGNYTANAAQFGVDKGAPTDSLLSPSNAACAAPGCAGDLGKYTANPVPNFVNSYNDPDGASGFNTTPLTTKLTRLAIDPTTLAPSTTNSAFGCPIGFSASAGTCGTAAAAGTIAADAGSNGLTSGTDGYYTYTATIMDLARNLGPTVTRQVVVDRVAPTMGGIAVPATIVGGTSASFATSATDNLDLVGTSYLLSYVVTPTGAATPLNIRAAGADIGVAFDNVLTTSSSFSLTVPFFVRSVSATTAGLPPNATGALASNIAVRVVDAAGNVSTANSQAISAVNINQVNLTNFATAVNGQTFTAPGFSVTNVATNVSNCPAAGCAGGVAPTNPTTVILTASAVGTETTTAQFQNPFVSVSWYYLTAANEWQLIGSATAPGVSDDVGQTKRTYSWTLATAFDPPTSLVAPTTLKVIAVGVNLLGDALVTDQNALISLTNP